MTSVLAFSFNAIGPVLLLIVVGYIAKRIGLLSDTTIKQMNKFMFRFCFPCMMINNVYGLDSGFSIPWDLYLFLIVSLAVVLFVSFIVATFVTKDNTRRPVIINAGFRSNYAIIGLVLAEGLVGKTAVQLASICQLPTILFFNIMAVTILSVYATGENRKVSVLGIAKSIFTNPIILGLLAGLLILVVRGMLPVGPDGQAVFRIDRDLPWLYKTIGYLASMVTPVALILLGAQLEIGKIGDYKKELVASVALRLVAAPVIGFGLVILADRLGILTITPEISAVLVATYGSPVAVASVVMSGERGADDKLAGQVVVWSSVFGMLTLFILCVVIRSIGII